MGAATGILGGPGLRNEDGELYNQCRRLYKNNEGVINRFAKHSIDRAEQAYNKVFVKEGIKAAKSYIAYTAASACFVVGLHKIAEY